MMARIRFLLFIAVAAVAGAVAGRVARELRRQQEAGEPLGVSLADVKIQVQDVVPGLVAAARVRDTPWSWLHIPSWLAAFAVNLGLGALGGDLSRVREMAERAAFGFAGIEIPRDEPETTIDAEPAPQPSATAAPPEWHSAPPAPASTPSAEPGTAAGGGSVTWTAPGPAERVADEPSGFTAFRD